MKIHFIDIAQLQTYPFLIHWFYTFIRKYAGKSNSHGYFNVLNFKNLMKSGRQNVFGFW